MNRYSGNTMNPELQTNYLRLQNSSNKKVEFFVLL